ncbi:sensor histidine kinase [Cohnella silvisoli]|uniref:Sensor histidine kinase n=1 Tax=Cohnella silvisoli TaxID=2873699 RepID=A0ABV1KSV6_9BACL|nr:sensor histidine kinase [Cohnella silvisoli]MCD9021684.1 sensor histidine kinase [Cohnella silvisoli]
MPIKGRLTVYLILFSVIPLITVSVFLYYQASNVVKMQAEKYAGTVLSQTTSTINQLMDDVVNASVKVVTDPNVQNDDIFNQGEFDRNVRYRTIEKLMTNVMMAQPEVSSMYLCLNNADLISVGSQNLANHPDCRSNKSYQAALDNNLMPLWIGMHENEFDEGTVSRNRYVMTLARTVYSFDTYKPLGVLLINIADQTINNNFQAGFDGEPAIFHVTDMHKNAIYVKDPAKYGTKLDAPYLDKVIDMKTSGGFVWRGDSGPKYISFVYSTKSDWIFVVELSIDYITRNSNLIYKAMIAIVTACFILSIMAAYFLARKFTDPIKNLLSSIRRVKDGQLNQTIHSKRKDEIGVLTQSYNSMIQEIRELLVRLDTENVMKRRAELDALQAQITPHFLYNSLNSIKSMARLNGQDLIYRTTTSLIGLLQLSISKNTVFIPLSEELEMVKHYLELQNVRYPNRIKALFEIEDGLSDCLTVKLILQPLVENAILHGLDLKDKGGIIVIRMYREGADIVMQVEDNGKGMEEAALRLILTGKPKEDGRRFGGLGLRNVNERLKLHYGEDYGISFHSLHGVSFVSTVRIPYRI